MHVGRRISSCIIIIIKVTHIVKKAMQYKNVSVGQLARLG